MPAGGALEKVGRDPLQVVQVQALGLEGKRFVRTLQVTLTLTLTFPGEIDFIFVTTGEAICSEEQTCDSCVMKSLILSRHPPPSSEKGCEPLFPDLHLCQFYILTVVVVDQRDDWRGNKTGENVQEGQTQHG